MTDHITEDTLLALALQEVTPPERELLSSHLAACASCRAEYDALADVVRHTLAAAPPIAPPAGFSGRVFAAMDRAPDEGQDAPGAAPTGQRRQWTPWLAAAAALVVGAGIGVGATLGVVGAGTPPAPTPTPTASAPSHVAPAASSLVTTTGDTVGTAGLALVDGRHVLVITVTRGRPGMSYDCVLVSSDGARTSGGVWELGADYGSEVAAGTWVVPVDGVEVERVELVAPSGRVWSSATF